MLGRRPEEHHAGGGIDVLTKSPQAAMTVRMSELGGRLKELREAQGKALREVAARAGIDYSYLSKIEQGTTTAKPSLRILSALATQFEVPAMDLIALSEKVPPPFDRFARDADARSFFDLASTVATDGEDWRALTGYLKKRASRRARA